MAAGSSLRLHLKLNFRVVVLMPILTERWFFVLTDTWCAVFHCIRLRDVWIAGGGKNVLVFISCYLNPDASLFFSGHGLVAVAVDLHVTQRSLRACDLMTENFL